MKEIATEIACLPDRTSVDHNILSKVVLFTRAPKLAASLRAASGRIFSGIQPTGIPHLGNYFGALTNWVALQDAAAAAAADKAQTIFSIVDLHAMSMPYDPKALRQKSVETAATLMACGISPERSILFCQSAVREHTELAWTLGCVTPLGWLQRMTQYKSKGSRDKAAAGLGLLSYPVLQAADILLYGATRVPVGDDQLQHLELARDIAEAFNARFGPVFTALPQPVLLPSAASRVMSLRDGTKKMSKSDSDDGTRINLTDSADTIRDKLRRAKTDSVTGFTFDPEKRPDKSNLLVLLATATGRTVEDVAAEHAESSALAFKEETAEALIRVVCPIGERMAALLANPAAIEDALEAGAVSARAIASKTMADVRHATGVV